ncbi:MAG: hypothetical protein K6F34_06440 [Lachnospiraceae bacterium]|nr:hypothetical protein [Lachnospiraceae bacterium]
MNKWMVLRRLSVLCFAMLVMIVPAKTVWADDPAGPLKVLKPQDGVYTYTKTDAEAGTDYVLYAVDGVDGADNVLDWDSLTGRLKYVDQKKADGASLSFEIPQNTINGNGTFYIGDGAENDCLIAGYLTQYDEAWADNGQSVFYFSDEQFATGLKTEYRLSSDRSTQDIVNTLPKTAYLKLQTAAPDESGAAGTYLAVPVTLEWAAPEGVEGFHAATDNELFFTATVTFKTESAAGKTGAAWAGVFSVPELKARITGPDKPDPKPQQYHRISVQNGAEAFLYTSATLDNSANSACNGEMVIIRWKRNYYYDNTSDDGYKFVKWVITGADPENESSPQTGFTMGDTDVTVGFIEQKIMEQESGEEEPENRDKTTKLSKLKYPKTSLTMVKGSSIANPAETAPAKGVSLEQMPDVIYVTDNKEIVSADKYGTFYANDVGDTVVTAYCGNKKATCKVTVISPTEKLVILDGNGRSRPDVYGQTVFYQDWEKKPEQTIMIKAGEQMTLKAQIIPCDSTDVKNVTWNVYAWPTPLRDKSGNPYYKTDKNGNLVYKKDSTYLTIKDGVISAKEANQPNYTPVLVSATVKRTVIDPLTGKTKTVDLTSMVPVYVHPIIPDKASNKEDKTHTLSLKKTAVSMVTTPGNNTFALDVTVASKQKTDAVVENYIIECESTNANVVSVDDLTDLAPADTKGKKGTATMRIRANNPGFAYIIVKSRNKAHQGAPNIQRCKVTVTQPVTGVSAVSGTLKISTGPIKVYNKKTRVYEDSETPEKILTMRKGSCGTIETLVTPYDATDLKNVKISASGGVKIKNGVISATTLTKPEKGGYAKVTVTCGKLKDTVYITVVK